MKTLFSILLIGVNLANPCIAQNYSLSLETVTEYKEIMAEYDDMKVGETILGIGIFMDIYESEPISGLVQIVMSDGDWSLYLSAIEGFDSFVNQRMATVCGANAISDRVSKNASDRKFWQKLYEYHKTQN